MVIVVCAWESAFELFCHTLAPCSFGVAGMDKDAARWSVEDIACSFSNDGRSEIESHSDDEESDSICMTVEVLRGVTETVPTILMIKSFQKEVAELRTRFFLGVRTISHGSRSSW